MLAVGRPVHVRKLKPSGTVDFAWDGMVVCLDASSIVLRAEFNVDVVEREWATFRRGDVFYEFYYFDHWYNIFQISSPDGTLKGWYANVGMPAVLNPETDELEYVDLALDVWTSPGGEHVVLDQDEFDTLLDEYPDLRHSAEDGRDALLDLVRSGRLPRWTK